MSQKGYIHRDLKTEKIYAKNDPKSPYNFNLAIADYRVQSACSNNSHEPGAESGLYDKRADIYSLGCILYKMIKNENPFKDRIDATKITQLNIGKPCTYFTMNLLEGCLQCDKSKRLPPKELLNILQIETLYRNYKPIVLGKVDTDQNIYLYEKRGLCTSNHRSENLLKMKLCKYCSLTK